VNGWQTALWAVTSGLIVPGAIVLRGQYESANRDSRARAELARLYPDLSYEDAVMAYSRDVRK